MSGPNADTQILASGIAIIGNELVVSGEISQIRGADAFAQVVAMLVAEQPPRDLVFDLRGVDFMDSIGLKTLITAHKSRDQVDAMGPLLVRPNRTIQRILEITGLSTVFKILPDVQDQPGIA